MGKRFVVSPGPGETGETTFLTVVGVVQDYHLTSLHQKIEPQLIQYDPDSLRMLSLRLAPGDLTQTLDLLKNAMSSFTVERRTKETGIRKVLGSSVPGIVRLLSKETVFLVVVANVIAWPTAYILMNVWLQRFA